MGFILSTIKQCRRKREERNASCDALISRINDLVKRSGPYGEFWGCSNYRANGCTYKRKIR